MMPAHINNANIAFAHTRFMDFFRSTRNKIINMHHTGQDISKLMHKNSRKKGIMAPHSIYGAVLPQES